MICLDFLNLGGEGGRRYERLYGQVMHFWHMFCQGIPPQLVFMPGFLLCGATILYAALALPYKGSALSLFALVRTDLGCFAIQLDQSLSFVMRGLDPRIHVFQLKQYL